MALSLLGLDIVSASRTLSGVVARYVMFDEWIDTPELAKRTRTSGITWAKRRMVGGDATPKFSKIGRIVRYRWSDVEAWLETRQRQSTSEAA